MDFPPIVDLPPIVEGWPYLSEDILMTIDNAQAASGVSSASAAPSASVEGDTPPSSIARVTTDRASRYGRQLVSHMGHKIDATWDDETSRGDMYFVRGDFRAHCSVECEDKTLVLALSTQTATSTDAAPASPDSPTGDLAGIEHVIGIHLARFGVKDALTVTWQRADGSAGTTQGPLTPEEIAEHRRQRQERHARGE